MAKEAKKPVRKAAMPALTKSNLLKLADEIYKDNGSQVTYTKLCGGNLCEVSGKKVMHCAIGEAYHTFVSSDHKDMVALNNLEFYRSPNLSYWDDCEDDEEPSMNSRDTTVDDPGTIKAADELVEKANLKTPFQKKRLMLAFLSVVAENDEHDDDEDDGQRARAEDVSEAFRQVAKLLK